MLLHVVPPPPPKKKTEGLPLQLELPLPPLSGVSGSLPQEGGPSAVVVVDLGCSGDWIVP